MHVKIRTRALVVHILTPLPSSLGNKFNHVKWVLNSFVEINASEGSLCFQIFILHNSRCQVPCGSCKSCPVLHFSVVIFFWSLGIIDTSTIKCWELSTAQAGTRGVRDVALILQFLCNFVLINASEGSLCSQILKYRKFFLLLKDYIAIVVTCQ
jgi:hypothetical protein